MLCVSASCKQGPSSRLALEVKASEQEREHAKIYLWGHTMFRLLGTLFRAYDSTTMKFGTQEIGYGMRLHIEAT